MMNFVIVNHRIPEDPSLRCAGCLEAFTMGYIRERQTGLMYCDMVCFKYSEKVAILAIEHQARNVS